MPYCVVFNCKSNSTVDRDVSWFSFPPKDTQTVRRKTWLHYCRRTDFVPSAHSKVCSKHFTPSQYSRDPAFYAMFGYKGARPALKTDAIPDVPWDYGTPTPVTTPIDTRPTPKPRSAVLKRRKLEILEEVLTCDSVSDQQLGPSTDVENENPTLMSDSQCHQSVQTNLTKQVRTRRIQVGKPVLNTSVVDMGIQCNIEEDLKLPCACLNPQDTCSESEFTYPDFDDRESDLNDSFSVIEDDSDFDPDISVDTDDDDEDVDTDGLESYQLHQAEDPLEERYFVVSETSLHNLLSTCKTCHVRAMPIVEYSRGTMISVTTACPYGHTSKWISQSMFSKMPAFNLMLSSAIMSSGCNISKVLRCLNQANVQSLSIRSVLRIQAVYTIPAIICEFKEQQSQLLDSIKAKQHVTLGGDGRCDSPGYSAKYGSYSLMDLEENKIINIELVQCNEVSGSTHMELEGLKRSLSLLDKSGVVVNDLVTDRHVMIKSFLKQQRPTINHFFDVWHITKGISKKLEAVAKRKGGEAVRPWIRSITNHCYWVAATSKDNQGVICDKWKSVTNHIANIHTHQSLLFPKCLHSSDDMDKDWITQGSRCHKLVKEIIESPYLLRDIPKMSPRHQTYGLEVFHSVVNQFAPKSTHFYHSAMLARLYVAALHFNENGKRVQATRKDGEAIWYQSYPKAKKGNECVVKSHKVPPTYSYVESIMSRVLQKRRDFPTLQAAKCSIDQGHKVNQPSLLTANFPKFEKATLIEQRKSRFQTNEAPS